MSKKSQDELREEHRSMGNALNAAKNERDKWDEQTQMGRPAERDYAQKQVDRIDQEMTDIREKQKEVYDEFRENRAKGE